MKKLKPNFYLTHYKAIVISSLLYFAILFNCSFTAKAQITDQQIEAIRTEMLTKAMSPDFWLPVTTPVGRVSYTFGSYYLNVNTSIANSYILSINKPENPEFAWSEFYFQMPNIIRFILDDRFSKNVNTEAKNHLFKLFFDEINANSNLVLTSEWNIDESENHNIIRKSTYYLASMALSNNPTYANKTLKDGRTVKEHRDAWANYWKLYFLNRAKKGLEIEIHSPTYTKYTLSGYYNLLDLSDDDKLTTIATNYMHLYWTDIAQHYLKGADIVGGASGRHYKKSIYSNFYQYPRTWTKLFGWTNTATGQHPNDFIGLVTNYKVPDIITKIATQPKTNFLITNASWGTVNTDGNIVFDTNGCGNVIRQSYITDNYAMGTTLFNPNKKYIAIANQNRVMGVYFNTTNNDRICIHGYSKVVNGEQKGYRDITGITGENCVIAWRPIDYEVSNAYGTRIFVNSAIRTNGIKNGGWWFNQVGNAYVAMRTANLSWTDEITVTGTSNYGNFELDDPDSPIIIECANKTDYATFASFQTAILANPFSFSNNVLTYTSTAGDSYKVYRKSYNLPLINGKIVNFNLTQTYNSPFLNNLNTNDASKITISYPGQTNLTINLALKNQTITFDKLPIFTVGDPDYTLNATASSGLSCWYSSSNAAVANISAGKLQILSAGTTTITANQGGNTIYNKAVPVSQVINVEAQPMISTRIEAESFTAKTSTINTQACSEGAYNIGWIKNSNYCDYTLNVAKAGTYKTAFRVASLSTGGTIEIYKGTTKLGSATVAVTTGWQTWVTVNGSDISLVAGAQTIRLKFVNTAAPTVNLFNVNWFEISGAGTVKSAETTESTVSNNSLNIYPNPMTVGEPLTIEGNVANTISVYNSIGEMIESQTITDSKLVLSSISKSGFYFVKVGSETIKLIVK